MTAIGQNGERVTVRNVAASQIGLNTYNASGVSSDSDFFLMVRIFE
jgi:hypothetical protein